MFVQSRARSGAALAAISLILFFSTASVRAAEVADFAGTWETQLSLNVEADDSVQEVATLPARLDLELTGVTMGGNLTVSTPEGETAIPIEGATFSGDRLSIQINFTNSAGDTSFDSVMKPLFGELGMDGGTAEIRFKGWLESSENNLIGRIDAEGFSMPGIVDALFLEVTGTKSAGPGVEPEPEDEALPMGEDGDEVAEVEEEPALEPLEQYQGLERPDLSQARAEQEPPEEKLHAGADAEVMALEAADLANRETAVQLSAARTIAEQERKRRERAEALRKLERVHTYEYNMVGETVEDVISEASVRALVTTASRLYYGNYVLVGRDLLEPYLRQSGEKFVVHAKILGQEVVAEGGRRVHIEVTVDTDALYNDLESKHFIAEPNFRPVMAVALEETLNDEPNPVSLARVTLEELLRQVDMRVQDQPLGGLERMDGSSDDSVLRQIREEAQRLNADVVVTGSIHLYGPESKIILFDQFYEVYGELLLLFVRADNSEVIRVFRTSFTSAAQNAEEAIASCIFRLSADAVLEMTDGLLDEWQMTMLDKTDYRLCITGADQKTVDVFENELRTFSPEIEIYRKSHFAEVAVLNFNLPGAVREQVELFLRNHKAPQFKVIPTARGHYELRVL